MEIIQTPGTSDETQAARKAEIEAITSSQRARPQVITPALGQAAVVIAVRPTYRELKDQPTTEDWQWHQWKQLD